MKDINNFTYFPTHKKYKPYIKVLYHRFLNLKIGRILKKTYLTKINYPNNLGNKLWNYKDVKPTQKQQHLQPNKKFILKFIYIYTNSFGKNQQYLKYRKFKNKKSNTYGVEPYTL